MGRLEHREGEPWMWQMAWLRGSIRIEDGSLAFRFDGWVVRGEGN